MTTALALSPMAALVALAFGLAAAWLLLKVLLAPAVPKLDFKLDATRVLSPPPGYTGRTIPCRDPGTGRNLGEVAAADAGAVAAALARARAAQAEWKASSFAQRRKLVAVLNRWTVENARAICEVSAVDSGKAAVDAGFGEVLTTCEKAGWLGREGERWLKPERRSAGTMMSYKRCWVEYVPVGVVGAIVPWNYPFHNVLNPVLAAVFAGNSVVVKVSEHAAWSGRLFGEVLDAACAVAGAPAGLIQVIAGYGDAGEALTTGGAGATAREGGPAPTKPLSTDKPGVDKLIFVGSQGVGRAVLRTAAETLTPVVLELGGKDPFVVCEDADLDTVVATALRGAFQSAGQNCAGAERFVVARARGCYERFLERAGATARAMRLGAASAPGGAVDMGAMCMPQAPHGVHALVEDAVARGARVVAGGKLPDASDGLPEGGSFYPPTVLADVPRSARIWREEVFGPVMVVVPFDGDDEAVALANDCQFGLGANVFSADAARALALGRRISSGMLCVNDFATTYMAQSLPFGGVGESGFDRFAGPEGLRGLTTPRAIAMDRWPIKTSIPPLLRYPVDPRAPAFVEALVRMFYHPYLSGKASGLLALARVFLSPAAPAKAKAS